jgi:hypothetical protein
VSFDLEPSCAADRIADAGMQAMEAQADTEGLKLADSIIALNLVESPPGELDATVHAHLESDHEPEPESVLAVLCAKAQTIAEQLGIPLEMTIRGRRA